VAEISGKKKKPKRGWARQQELGWELMNLSFAPADAEIVKEAARSLNVSLRVYCKSAVLADAYARAGKTPVGGSEE